MKIGIDAHILGKNKGGVEVYLFNLIRRLQEIDRKNSYVVYLNPAYDKRHIDAGSSNFSFKNIAFHSPWLRYSLSLPFTALKDKVDILHTQRAVPLWFNNKRVILTIHDVAHEVAGSGFDIINRLILRNIIKSSARAAARIITVSENSKKEIVKYFMVPEERITLAYNGINAQNFDFNPVYYANIADEYKIRQPFLLSIGAIEPRKNLEAIVEITSLLKKRLRFGGSVVVMGGSRSGGRSGYYAGIKKLMEEKELQPGDLVFTGYQSNEFKNTLLSRAVALIQPSFYEGFGIPVLEGMSFGIPLVLSRIPVFLELFGNCALFADPYKPEEFFNQISALFDNKDLTLELKRKESAEIARFGWDKTAMRHIEAYMSFGI